MDAQLNELAAQIARQEAYQHLAFWIVLGALLIVGVFISAFLYRYADKVADIKVQTDKLPEIKAQLAETTRTTEEIKAEVGQKDWRERERLTLYRDRIEKVLSAVYALQSECSRQYIQVLGEAELSTDEAPGNRVQVIVALYFPGLRLQALALQTAALTFCHNAKQLNTTWRLYRFRVAHKQSALERPQIDADYERASDELTAAMKTTYGKFLSASADFEEAIRGLIAQYIP